MTCRLRFANAHFGSARRLIRKPLQPQNAGKERARHDSRVRKGGLLMAIDPTNYTIAVSQAEAAVQQAQASIQNIDAQITVQ